MSSNSPAGEESSVYDHCCGRSIAASRAARTGLPSWGAATGNEPDEQGGRRGGGESVWVGWFLLVLLDRFLPVMEEKVGTRNWAQDLPDRRAAASGGNRWMNQAWDGEWYHRAARSLTTGRRWALAKTTASARLIHWPRRGRCLPKPIRSGPTRQLLGGARTACG